MKKVVAVAPLQRKGVVNFKQAPYEAWKKIGGKVANPHYLFQPFISFFHNHELPSLGKSGKEARLRFVEPINRKFDAFPDYAFFEIVPFIWDCWPCLDDRLSTWLERHEVRLAIFTSEQAAERIQNRFPNMKILVVTEGIDISKCFEGKPLNKRSVDVLEFGRSNHALFDSHCFDGMNHVCTKELKKRLSDKELQELICDSKITIALPKCDTDAQIGAGQETLTQRFWENMLSRTIMVGHAPKELVDLIGYNPCIELDGFCSHKGMSHYQIKKLDTTAIHYQLKNILDNISSYQSLVDKNRNCAQEMAPWEIRMETVQKFLIEQGYTL